MAVKLGGLCKYMSDSMPSSYEIETDQNNITIRLPRQFADEKMLSRFLDYLELESIRQRSRLTEDDAQELASEVQESAWKQVRHLFDR